MEVPGKACLQAACAQQQLADESSVAGGRSQRKESEGRQGPEETPDGTLGKSWNGVGFVKGVWSLNAFGGWRATGKDPAGEGMRLKSSPGLGFSASPHHSAVSQDQKQEREQAHGRRHRTSPCCLECWPVTVKPGAATPHHHTMPCHAIPHEGPW